MKGQPLILKLLKQRLWILLPLLGLLALGSTFLLSGRSQPAPTSVVASPMPTPSPIASKITPASPEPQPTASPSASPKAAAAPSRNSATPAAEPQAEPSLTPEQQSMNQQAKAAFETSLASVDSLIEMRVAIAKGVSALTLSVDTPADLIDENGKHLGSLAAGESYTVQANGQSISLNALELPSLAWVEPSAAGAVTVGDRTYRGRLLLAVNDSHLWGVNFVNLRQYLYSVVASEVSPSWPMEALKAQAVAARSYALTYYFKPVNSLYQLGDDEYFQVYSGVAREADTTNKAVDATAGQFVSYRGGIVESLY
ncbi:MAG TPA: SpoIID/LytB domain-containing protein, partial [Coleofasciculaceae cyanobacterium]